MMAPCLVLYAANHRQETMEQTQSDLLPDDAWHYRCPFHAAIAAFDPNDSALHAAHLRKCSLTSFGSCLILPGLRGALPSPSNANGSTGLHDSSRRGRTKHQLQPYLLLKRPTLYHPFCQDSAPLLQIIALLHSSIQKAPCKLQTLPQLLSHDAWQSHCPLSTSCWL